MSKIQIKTKTVKDVLNEYINKYQPKDADLLDLFGVSRQALWNYKMGHHQAGLKRLYEIAMAHKGEWEGEMALEMLETMGVTILVQKAVTA